LASDGIVGEAYASVIATPELATEDRWREPGEQRRRIDHALAASDRVDLRACGRAAEHSL
jgi:hypothetical protein